MANPFDRPEFARLYDWEHERYLVDVDMHIGFAGRFGGPVLELACGTGRLLAPLAQAGFADACTGVDSSAAMLDRARQRLVRVGARATLVQQHLEALDLGAHFRTIILGLDSFGLLLERDVQVKALRAARAHATHDARLILDVANGNLRGSAEPAEELLHDLTQPDLESGRPITKFVLRQPRPAEQLDDLLLFYDEQDERGFLRRSNAQLRVRWFTRFELELLLDTAGWQVDELYGNYELEPFGPDSDRLIVVSRLAPEEASSGRGL